MKYNNDSDVVVVGGGVIGLFCAYYLNQQGLSVTVLDKGPKHAAASHGNCGLISPSHVLPLNTPKLILKSLWWMFQPSAPFYIKPQVSLPFYGWLLQFVLHTNAARKRKSTYALHTLLSSSRSLYSQIMEQENFSCAWQSEGILFVCKTQRAFQDLQGDIDFTAQAIGLSATPFTGSALTNKEPAIRDDVYGAWLYDVDAHLKPDRLISALTGRLSENGVSIISNCPVSMFDVDGNKIRTARTPIGDFKAKNFVVAGGAESARLMKTIGVDVPIIPGKGYSITMKKPGRSPKIPCIMQERKVVATPWNDGSYRLGGTMELSGFDTTINRRRLDALKSAAKDYLVDPFTEETIEEWYGWRSMTYDGVPIIDWVNGFTNLVMACGHNMLGLSTGPATGKLVAELVTGQKGHVAPAFYSMNR